MKPLGWVLAMPVVACVADPESIGASSESTTGDSSLPAECQGAFQDSWDAWHGLMTTSGTSYVYTRVETIAVAGDTCNGEPVQSCELRTTITIEAGMPTSRELVVTPGDGPAPDACPAGYVETSNQVGASPDGAHALTIDQLYQGCCDVGTMNGGFGEEFGQASYSVDAMGVLAGCSDLLCDDCGCSSSLDYTIEDLAFAN
jgi:hypothetical protein